MVSISLKFLIVTVKHDKIAGKSDRRNNRKRKHEYVVFVVKEMTQMSQKLINLALLGRIQPANS